MKTKKSERISPLPPTSVRSRNACYKSQGDVTYHKRNTKEKKGKYPIIRARADPGEGDE